jgi:hypothetical protein
MYNLSMAFYCSVKWMQLAHMLPNPIGYQLPVSLLFCFLYFVSTEAQECYIKYLI